MYNFELQLLLKINNPCSSRMKCKVGFYADIFEVYLSFFYIKSIFRTTITLFICSMRNLSLNDNIRYWHCCIQTNVPHRFVRHVSASVLPTPHPPTTKLDDHGFVNQALDTPKINQDVNILPTCNGSSEPNNAHYKDGLESGLWGTANTSDHPWTCSSNTHNNNSSSLCNSVELTRNGSVSREKIDGAKYNCVTGLTDCSAACDEFSVIDRSSPPSFLQKSRIDWLKYPELYKVMYRLKYSCAVRFLRK